MSSSIKNSEKLQSYQVVLSPVFEQVFQKEKATAQAGLVATTADSTSDRNDYNWLGSVPSVRKWIGERQAQQLKAFQYSVYNDPWEYTHEVDAYEVDDDQGGLLPRLKIQANAAGIAMARHADELVYGEGLKNGHTNKCFDGVSFFNASHPNPTGTGTFSNVSVAGASDPWYLLDVGQALKPLLHQVRMSPTFAALTDPNGQLRFYNRKFVFGAECRDNFGYTLPQFGYRSTQTLNAANLEAAYTIMSQYKNDQDKQMGIDGTLLIVPTSLKFTAAKLLGQSTLASGEDNWLKGQFSWITSKYL